MIRLPPDLKPTDHLFPYTTLFLSLKACIRSSFFTQCAPGPACKGSFHVRHLSAARAVVRQCPRGHPVRPARRPGPDSRGHRVLDHRRGRSEGRSEEHTSELQSLMRISYAVFCLKKKKPQTKNK